MYMNGKKEREYGEHIIKDAAQHKARLQNLNGRQNAGATVIGNSWELIIVAYIYVKGLQRKLSEKKRIH